MSGPVYVWIDDETGECMFVGEQVVPGAPPVAARTMVIVETREEAEDIRDSLQRGDVPDVGTAISGTSAYAPDGDPARPRPELLDD